MRIAVIGTGYVGLVAGTCFADTGNNVVCVDLDAEKVASLRKGVLPIYEPGLEELVRRNVGEGRLHFTTSTQDAVAQAEVVFIAVGTPQGENGDADLKHVLAAAGEIGKALTGYAVIVDKSTVPVGTADLVRQEIAKVTAHPFDVVSNPEFLKEGAALDDFLKPDRVVIGVDSERAREVMGELYAPFVRTGHPVLYMDPRSAELTKYAANSMLAARISFMNDLAVLCEKLGADIDQVRRGMGADKRIGTSFLFPGVGYGGSCFPKDVRALISTAREHALEFELLHAVEKTNARQKRLLVERVKGHLGETLVGRNIAVWGLAFKPRTDDMREAPSLEIIDGLLQAGAQVTAYDPVAMTAAKRVLGDRIQYANSPYDALQGADGLCLVTEWNDFRHPDFERMRTLMRQPIIFDGRNVFEPKAMRARGFTYFGIGRP